MEERDTHARDVGVGGCGSCRPSRSPLPAGARGRVWKRWGCSGDRGAVPPGPAGTRRAVRLSCLQSWVLHRASRGGQLEQSFAAARLQSPPGSACSAPAVPVPLLRPRQAGSCLAPQAGMRHGDLDAQEEAGKGTGIQQYLPDCRPGLTGTLLAVGFGYLFPPFPPRLLFL